MIQIFILKLLVSIIVVVGLSLIAENVSPKIAGILSGCPTGSAISLFFFGLENSPEFAGESALFNVFGISASLVFLYVYYQVSLYTKRFVILQSSIYGIIAFLVSIYLLQFLSTMPSYISVVISVLMVLLFKYLFKKIDDIKIVKKSKPTLLQMTLRGGLAAVIILAITGVSTLLGAKWAGLISAFPTTLFPLLLIMHYTYSKEHVHSIIKNVPTGTLSLILYALAIYFAYPSYGIYTGTVIAYGVVVIYLIAFKFINTMNSKKENLNSAFK